MINLGKLSPVLIRCSSPQKTPLKSNPVKIFQKPKYLAAKKTEYDPVSPTIRRKFETIKELNNENSQIYIEDIPSINDPEERVYNIFSSDINDNPDFYDKFIGPRFDQSGNLIKYSIVGKPDRFLRKYNQSADCKRNFDSRASLYSPKNSYSQTQLEFDNPSKTDSAFLRRSVAKKTTLISAATAINATTKINPKRNIVRMNKHQVKYEIQKIEERLQQNSSNDELLMSTLKRNDQLYMNKEERILKKKKQNEKKWEEQINILRNKVPRSKSEHLIESSEDYRYKKEKAEIIDLFKTDNEKYGSKYWYSSIRSGVAEDLKKLGVGLESMKTFNKSLMNLKNSRVEIIRGTHKSNREGGYTEKVMNMINLRRNIKDEYLMKIIAQNKRKMNVLQPVETIEGCLNGFEVKGENKFSMEKTSLENLTENYDHFFKEKPDPKNDKNDQIEHEVIASDYTSRDLFNKTGSNIFPKIISTFSFSH